MSNLGDLWKDLTGKQSDAVGEVGDILGTLADISGAVGFVQMGIGLIQSLFSQDDQVQQTLNAIWNDMNQIKQLILVEDKLQRMRDIVICWVSWRVSASKWWRL